VHGSGVQLILLSGVLLLVGLWLFTTTQLVSAGVNDSSLARVAAAPNRAGLVVQHSDGTVKTQCVEFISPTITGLQLLQLSGLAYTDGGGGFITAIDGEACTWGGPGCWWWSYWLSDSGDGAWSMSMVGAGTRIVQSGAVDGWHAHGETSSAPDAYTFAQICGQALTHTPAHEAADWLRTLQLSDGSYAGFGGNTGSTADTLLAASAVNANSFNWRSSRGNSLIDYVRATGAAYARTGASAAGKLAMAVAAADLDPRHFAGLDLVISVTNYYSPATGLYGFSNWDQAFAIMGLVAAGETVPLTATQALEARMLPDGSWGWSPAWNGSKVDSTALALQALAAAGRPLTATSIVSGVAFLKTQQNGDGGFSTGDSASDPSNTNSTALAVQGILAAGSDPLSTLWTISSSNPISFMLSLQGPDGSLHYTAAFSESRQMATQQGIPALTGRPFPYASRAVALRKAIDWIASQQQADGSFAGFGAGATLDAVLAIASTGRDPQSFVSSGGKTPGDFLVTQVPTYSNSSAAAAGKMLVGAVLVGGNPTDFGGVDLVLSVNNTYSPTIGQYGSSVWDQAWAMIGLAAANQTIPPSATQRLAEIRDANGGWGFGAFGSFGVDPDSTGLALMALQAGGEPISATAVVSGLAYLQAAQNPDGGFPGYGGDTSASSTGLALQGLIVYGVDPEGLDWTTSYTDPSVLTWHTPIDAILDLQSPIGGFAGFSGPNDPGATYQAVPGIAYKSFPLQFAIPQADFTASPLTITVGSSVSFTNTSQGQLLISDWDFGDGQTSRLFNPAPVVYTHPGHYTVTLTVADPYAQDNTLMRPSYITVLGQVYLPLIMR
jgi:prenyltransferase beta subunit